MKLVALCGAAGAGKDTVADMLPARKLAFADTLYSEVAQAFGVTVEELRCREGKELEVPTFAWWRSDDEGFRDFMAPKKHYGCPLSPRQILQWWGDYRRAQDPDYFVNALLDRIEEFERVDIPSRWVITDVRFPNEAAMVRQLGGQIWQIRRPGYAAGGTGHASDTDGSEFGPDCVVVNSGSLEDLQAAVLAAWGLS